MVSSCKRQNKNVKCIFLHKKDIQMKHILIRIHTYTHTHTASGIKRGAHSWKSIFPKEKIDNRNIAPFILNF